MRIATRYFVLVPGGKSCIAQLFVRIEKLGLEGIVAKRADSLYLGGRTKDWLKVKTRSGTEAMGKRIETWGR